MGSGPSRPIPIRNCDMDIFSNVVSNASGNLYQTSALIHGNGSFMISPINILYTIFMLYLGTNGQSKSELESSFNFKSISNSDLSVLSDAFASNQADLINGTNLRLANGIFLQKGLSLKKDYHRAITESLKSRIAIKDFAQDFEGARNDINKWGEEKTEGKIKEILPVGSLNSLSRFVLTSAVYFKSEWQIKFKDVFKGDFHLPNGEKKSVDMMRVTGQFEYSDIPKWKARYLEIPYNASIMSFLIVIPNEGVSLRDLEAGLDMKMTAKTETTLVQLTMPKFKLESQFDLKTMLKKLGVNHVFSEQADLSGMTGKSGEMKITDAFHKTFIDVNQNGTEAAGLSAVVGGLRSAGNRFKVEPLNFNVDRPFIFAIRHNPSGTIVFIGRTESL